MNNRLIKKLLATSVLLTLVAFIAPSCTQQSSYTASAMFAKYSDLELVKASDAILTGEIIGITQISLDKDRVNLNLAVVQVEQVLKGDAKQTIFLLELPLNREGISVSTDIFYHQNQKGLWFLRQRNQSDRGIYRADHPQRFLAMEEATNQIEKFRTIIKQEK